jgi:NhaP-type Na+/H+ or K+/H+ antiporter
MGSVFYLAFAFHELEFDHVDEMWAIVALAIFLSIVLHGITASPVIDHLKEKIQRERIPH